jgi:hypothetical protein
MNMPQDMMLVYSVTPHDPYAKQQRCEALSLIIRSYSSSGEPRINDKERKALGCQGKEPAVRLDTTTANKQGKPF